MIQNTVLGSGIWDQDMIVSKIGVSVAVSTRKCLDVDMSAV